MFMNKTNTMLSILSLLTMSAGICMVKPTGLPLPDPTGFRHRPVEVPSLLELASEEVFQQVDGYIKDVARQSVDPAIAAKELFERYIPEHYFDDCLKQRFVSEYSIKLYRHLAHDKVRLYDGRKMKLRTLRLNQKAYLKSKSPLNLLDSRNLITVLIRAERAKLTNAQYPN